MFAGIGAQAKAMELLNLDFEHWKICEFDERTVESYNAIHNTDFKPSDIKKLHCKDLDICDLDKFTYIMTYSYPCTDISQAGLRKGMERGSGTNSSLLWEVERLLKECHKENCKPQILLMENVRECHNGKNAPLFFEWTAFLRSIGYKNFYADLNAKNYGIPQSRERCFMLSILDENAYYDFPMPVQLKYFVKDYLEEQVDEKYFLSEDKAQELLKKMEENYPDAVIIDDTYGFDGGHVRYFPDTCPTLRAGNACLKCVVAMRGRKNPDGIIEQKLEPNKSGCSNTITSVTKDNLVIVYDDYNSKIRDDQNTIGTITTNIGNQAIRNGTKIISDKRVRILTPKEVWRLFAFEDKDVENASKVVPNTKLYKQGGNSIVVNCLVAILGQLFVGKENVYKDIANRPLFNVDTKDRSDKSDDMNLFDLLAI